MLNINYGHNQVLMERCKKLDEYAYFVSSVRHSLGLGSPLEEALELSINECIEKNKLADLLCRKRGEVKRMLLTDFDRKEYERMLKRDSYEDGKNDGMKLGIEQGIRSKQKELAAKKLQKGNSIPEIAKLLEETEDLVRELAEEIHGECPQADTH